MPDFSQALMAKTTHADTEESTSGTSRWREYRQPPRWFIRENSRARIRSAPTRYRSSPVVAYPSARACIAMGRA